MGRGTRSSAREQGLPYRSRRPFQRLMVPLVFDHVIAAAPLRGRRELGGNQPVELVLPATSATVSKRSRRIDSGASTSTTASNSDGSAASNRRGMSLTTTRSPRARASARSSRLRRCTSGCMMAVERFQSLRIRQNHGPELGAVQGPVGTDHLPAEPVGDPLQAPGARASGPHGRAGRSL